MVCNRSCQGVRLLSGRSRFELRRHWLNTKCVPTLSALGGFAERWVLRHAHRVGEGASSSCKAAGERDKLVGRVQERYGIAKEAAERQVDDWVNRS